MTTPDGHRTDYTYDAAGRLVAVDHPLLGRAVLERDAAGRLVQATADGIIQTWEHHDGFVVAHVVTDAAGSTRTLVSRDDEGRITGIDRDGATTTLRLRRGLPAGRGAQRHRAPAGATTPPAGWSPSRATAPPSSTPTTPPASW